MQFSEIAFHSLAHAFFPAKNCSDGTAKMVPSTSVLIAALVDMVARASEIVSVISIALPSRRSAK